eukprot:GFYU01009224.1.p1 GENE.GFYU01009224.1~~GFYU01009224.1.p1  ORF type:complete len:457 (-),score=103.36 GFYU01009224.1:182-1552(-)
MMKSLAITVLICLVVTSHYVHAQQLPRPDWARISRDIRGAMNSESRPMRITVSYTGGTPTLNIDWHGVGHSEVSSDGFSSKYVAILTEGNDLTQVEGLNVSTRLGPDSQTMDVVASDSPLLLSIAGETSAISVPSTVLYQKAEALKNTVPKYKTQVLLSDLDKSTSQTVYFNFVEALVDTTYERNGEGVWLVTTRTIEVRRSGNGSIEITVKTETAITRVTSVRVDAITTEANFRATVPGAEVKDGKTFIGEGASFFINVWLVPTDITSVEWWITNVMLMYLDGAVKSMQCTKTPTTPTAHPGGLAKLKCDLPSDVIGTMKVVLDVEWRGVTNPLPDGVQGRSVDGKPNTGTMDLLLAVGEVGEDIDQSATGQNNNPVPTVGTDAVSNDANDNQPEPPNVQPKGTDDAPKSGDGPALNTNTKAVGQVTTVNSGAQLGVGWTLIMLNVLVAVVGLAM